MSVKREGEYVYRDVQQDEMYDRNWNEWCTGWQQRQERRKISRIHLLSLIWHVFPKRTFWERDKQSHLTTVFWHSWNPQFKRQSDWWQTSIFEQFDMKLRTPLSRLVHFSLYPLHQGEALQYVRRFMFTARTWIFEQNAFSSSILFEDWCLLPLTNMFLSPPLANKRWW